MSAPRFRPLTLLLVLGVIAMIATRLLYQEGASNDSAGRQTAAPNRPASVTTPKAEQAAATTPAPEAAAPATPPTLSGQGKREMQAYRLAVRAGIVSLDAVENIAGDFRQRRGPVSWMPGMWCVRLLDSDMRVLAEEIAAAPDERCVVLDPNNKDAIGVPQATQFAGAGEEAMLQVRLPPQPRARWLKVYRLGGLQRADWNTEPLGQVLASISLPQ